MRIGILGGSFDPVHKGHLGIAAEVQGTCALDLLVFIPSSQAPLKNEPTETSPENRLAMLQAALKEYPGNAEISTFEIERGGTNYSIDTARHLKKEHPDTELYWIIGADQVTQLHRWHEIRELGRLVTFIVVSRPGHPPPERPDMPWLQLHPCETRQYEISSTEIRERIHQGESPDTLQSFLPKTVAEYIRSHHLYR